MSAKIKRSIVIADNGLPQQKITFKGCDRETSQIGFKIFLNVEKCPIVHNTSKLNWKGDLLGGLVLKFHIELLTVKTVKTIKCVAHA